MVAAAAIAAVVSERVTDDPSEDRAPGAPSTDDKSAGVLGSAAGGLAGAGAALFAALCCVGPSTVALFGAGGALAAASLKPYRSFLLLGSLAMILYGFWRVYGQSLWASGTRVCSVRVGRLGTSALWLASLVWMGALLLFFKG